MGGPGNDCVVLMLGLLLECDIAACSNLATKGFVISTLCWAGDDCGLCTI